MKVAIVEREAVSIAYFRYQGPYGEAIARFWDEVYVPWATRHKLGPGHPRYGVCHDDPGITAPEQCRYDACAEVSPDLVVDGGALKAMLPGGRYAVLGFHGSVAALGEAWTALFRDWLPASGYRLDARPCFEHYPRDAASDPRARTFACELCVPVMPVR